jgi:cell division protein FtsW (lipid II flippase)
MQYFWLAAAIIIFVLTTYMSIVEGLNKWVFYYVFVVIALLMFFMKKWMVKRMEKHMKFLEEQQNRQEN